MNEKCWCERSLFYYGYLTGVFAIGFVLLRIVDPSNKSKTLNDVAVTSPFTTLLEIFTWSFCPPMLILGNVWIVIGLFAAISIGCLIISRSCGWGGVANYLALAGEPLKKLSNNNVDSSGTPPDLPSGVPLLFMPPAVYLISV